MIPCSVGYDSERPTVPIKIKREARLARLKDALTVLGTAFALLGSAWGLVWSAISSFATDAEVSETLAQHDASAAAHARLRDRLDAAETALRGQQNAQHDAQAQLIALWRRQVSYAAADREDDRRLRAAAASFYREAFDRLVRAGVPPEQAFRDSLVERWPDRPHLR